VKINHIFGYSVFQILKELSQKGEIDDSEKSGPLLFCISSTISPHTDKILPGENAGNL
jgi:hypothetical protein